MNNFLYLQIKGALLAARIDTTDPENLSESDRLALFRGVFLRPSLPLDLDQLNTAYLAMNELQSVYAELIAGIEPENIQDFLEDIHSGRPDRVEQTLAERFFWSEGYQPLIKQALAWVNDPYYAELGRMECA